MLRRLHRHAALAVLLSLVSGVAACDSHRTGTAEKPTVAPPPTPTRAQAEAAAKAINFSAADFPGYEVIRAGKSLDRSPRLPVECQGLDSYKIDPRYYVVQEPAEFFQQGSEAAPALQRFSSEVMIFKSLEDARNKIAGLQTEKGGNCLGATVRNTYAPLGRGSGVRFTDYHVQRLRVSARGTDGVFAYSVTANLAFGAGGTIPLELDMVGCLKFHTESSLTAFFLGQRASKSLREELFARIVERTLRSAV